jgi:hypothetical protein
MDGSLSTIARIEKLLRETNLNAAKFSVLCSLYGIKFSDSSLARATQLQRLNDAMEKQLNPLVRRIEDLIERGKPFAVSFANPEQTKDLMDLVAGGIDLRVGEPLADLSKINNSGTQR